MKDQEGSASVAVMRDIQAGLGRCIAQLIAALNKETGGGSSSDWDEDDHDDLVFVGREEKEATSGEADDGVQPVLMRALCEVVRCAEEVSF
jgi:hypothetical protein